MSWLARSIANSLKLDDDNDDDSDHDLIHRDKKNIVHTDNDQINNSSSPSQSSSPSSPRGVKDDLSELTKTLSRQFWGVASFLAPPPQDEPSPPPRTLDSEPRDPSRFAVDSDPDESDSLRIAGIRSDFAEIGGKFKSGISKLSNNIGVSEFTKIASSFLQLGPEQEEYGSVGGAVGVTEEVVAFVRDISMHPETWLDFPLPDDDEEDDEFDLSDAQQEHALAVERFAPSLTALRIELCPGYMSEDCFWKIYFVLLHPKLNQHDAELLSTPDIVKARALLAAELRNQTTGKMEQERPQSGNPYTAESRDSQHEENLSVPSDIQLEPVPHEPSAPKLSAPTGSADFVTEKHPLQSNEIQIIDKTVTEERPMNSISGPSSHSSSSRFVEDKYVDDKYEDDGDDWLKEETSEIVGEGVSTIPIENEEDVSFSDLEEDDDDDGDVPVNYKKAATSGSDSSTKDSRDWVQLGRSSSDSPKDISTVTTEQHAGSDQVSARSSETKESNDWLNVDDIDVV